MRVPDRSRQRGLPIGYHHGRRPTHPEEKPRRSGASPEPTPGFEPGTPSLRVKCSGQLSYVGSAARIALGPAVSGALRWGDETRFGGPRAWETSGQRMNGHRYRNYLFVLEVLESDIFTSVERELLADAAEGLLLTRLPERRPDR